MEKGDVFVVSAPSGSGKTTICRMLVTRLDGISLSVSYTTRPRRQGETEGKDYYFIEPDKFDRMVVSRAFLEHASVYGHRYGTSREAVSAVVSRGDDVVLEIDVQGGRAVKRELPGAILIAVLPPDRRSLEERLVRRGRDSAEEMRARLRAADDESKELLSYDYIVVNDDLGAAVNSVEWIVRAARLRRERALVRMAGRNNESGEGTHGESNR